jgi:hypothetical protein
MLVADRGGPAMFARIGVMRALNRHVERVFDPSRKEKHWGASANSRAIDEASRRGRNMSQDERGRDRSTGWRRVRSDVRCTIMKRKQRRPADIFFGGINIAARLEVLT